MRIAPLVAAVGVTLLLAGNPAGAAARTVDWTTVPSDALERAADDKLVFVDAWADWCAECHEMDRDTFSDPAVVRALDAFVPLRVDVDAQPGFARRHRLERLPTLLLLDGRGREVARFEGARDARRLIADLAPWLERAACSVEGHVHPPDGVAPASVEILVSPIGRSVRADATGGYCVRGLDPGDYVLLALSGNHASPRTPVRVEPGVARHVELELTPSVQERVVVTGTRTMKLLRDSPVRTELVDREQIESAGARTLADAVEFTPGVRVESNCQNCNFSQVRMLGLGGGYSQVLVDGQAQWSPLGMVYGIEQLPSRYIDSLEIVKGGGSTIYGAGAVGGVINVIPRRPFETGGTVDLRTEWPGGGPNRSLSATWDWVSDDGAAFVSVYSQDDRVRALDLSGDGFSEIAKRDLRSFGVRGSAKLLEGAATLTADAGFSESDRRGGDRIEEPLTSTRLAEWIATDRRALSLKWEHALSSRVDYRLAASRVDTARDTYYGAGGDPSAFGTSDNPLWLFENQWNFRRDRGTWSIGAQFQSDRVRDEQAAHGRLLDETYENAGLFVQREHRVNARSEWIYGIRVDKHSAIDDPIVSPRVALRVAPNRALTFRSSLSTGFRPPAAFDEDLHIELAGGSGRTVELDPGLEEERSISVMQGVEWIPRFGKGYGLVEANLFYTGLTDVFEQEEIAPNRFLKVNAGDAEVYGVEWGVGFDLPERFTVEAGWVFQRSRFGTPERDFGSRDFFRTPESYGVLRCTWNTNAGVDLFLGARYTGSMLVPRYRFDGSGNPSGADLESSESFLVLDLSASREWKVGAGPPVVATVGVRNLTDEYQREIDQGEFRDTDYVYGPRFPRSVYGSLGIRF